MNLRYLPLIFLLSLLSACPDARRNGPVAIPRSPASWPTQGWPEAYDAMVRERVTPALEALEASRVRDLCPRWNHLAGAQRREFYASLFRAMARSESRHDRGVMALEKTFKHPDPVTGKPVVSEGLLQLSYQDERSYSGCDFDFEGDAKAFEEDWKLQDSNRIAENRLIKSWRAKNVNRDILQPESQLRCSLFIADRLVSRHPASSLATALGKYWYVVNPRHSRPYGAIRRELREGLPYCHE